MNTKPYSQAQVHPVGVPPTPPEAHQKAGVARRVLARAIDPEVKFGFQTRLYIVLFLGPLAVVEQAVIGLYRLVRWVYTSH